ncbi:endolytic transglycosylase MltG [Anaerocolumna aminovalerica]|nr:endolytic transglycosylase MltG [Anaerocolumna aminovalerica]
MCNPGIKAINAALNPAQTEYLYFYSDENGEYHFSKEYVNPKANASIENVTK